MLPCPGPTRPVLTATGAVALCSSVRSSQSPSHIPSRVTDQGDKGSPCLQGSSSGGAGQSKAAPPSSPPGDRLAGNRQLLTHGDRLPCLWLCRPLLWVAGDTVRKSVANATSVTAAEILQTVTLLQDHRVWQRRQRCHCGCWAPAQRRKGSEARTKRTGKTWAPGLMTSSVGSLFLFHQKCDLGPSLLLCHALRVTALIPNLRSTAGGSQRVSPATLCLGAPSRPRTEVPSSPVCSPGPWPAWNPPHHSGWLRAQGTARWAKVLK